MARRYHRYNRSRENSTYKIAEERMNSITNEAIQEGLRNLVRDYPRFASFEVFLDKHIDEVALKKKIRELKTNMDISPGEAYKAGELFRDKVVDYVSSGQMLDEEGKEKILETRTEEDARKGFLYRMFHRPKTKGTKELSKTFRAFDNLYALVKSGDHEKDKAELEKALRTLRGMDFYDPAIEILRDGDLIDGKGEKRMRKLLESRIKEGKYVIPKITEDYLKQPSREIEHYIKPAAGILAFFGLGLVLGTSQGITGSAIRYPETFSNTGGLIGGGLLILGLILFLIVKTKQRKQKSKFKDKKNKTKKKSK